MDLQKSLNKLLREDEVRALMQLYSTDEIDNYIKQRKVSIGQIKEFDDEETAKEYLELCAEIDVSLNDDEFLIEGITEMLNTVLVKMKKEKSFQILSFCIMYSGDPSIIIRTYEDCTPDVSPNDLSIFYTKDSNELFCDLDEENLEYLEEEYDFRIEDLWSCKYYAQIDRCIKKVISEYDVTQLNIKYPLQVYIDAEGEGACSGDLLIKINE